MSRECGRRSAIALVVGLLVTMLLGLSPNHAVYGELPNVGIAYKPILGVGYWGYILPWLRKVVYPGSPLEVVWPNFVADIGVWTLLSYAVFLLIERRHAIVDPRST